MVEEEIILPELLNIPPKLMPMLLEFQRYKYFLVDGGRGSAKTQSVARILLYIADSMHKRIGCGRETQSSIEESVYTVFSDLIQKHELDFEVLSTKINHHKSGSTIRFKGFREQGSVNIKGWEAVDILWIDEAQSITVNTLNIIVPTIRQDDSKLIFTMNRHVREDPVYTFLSGRKDCLHIHIDYFENPYCPLTLKIEAEECRRRSEKEYDHIWLGKPLEKGSDYLFSSDDLDRARTLETYGDFPFRQRVIGIDIAAQGGDLCVATVIDRKSTTQWELVDIIYWDDLKTNETTGKIIGIIGTYRPNVTIIDEGNMGVAICDAIDAAKIPFFRFNGAWTKGIDTVHYANARSEAYHFLNSWFEQGYLKVGSQWTALRKELDAIRYKYRSNGQRLIFDKLEIKKETGCSTDHSDSLMMAVWGAMKHLKESATSNNSQSIKRIDRSGRHK